MWEGVWERFECGKLGWLGRFGEGMDRRGVDFGVWGKEENMGEEWGKSVGGGEVGGLRRKDGGKGDMCGLGRDGIWGVGEVTYLFLVNFFEQIRAKNPRLIRFLLGSPLIFELKKATNIK